MNKQRRDESEMKHKEKHREPHKKHMSSGGSAHGDTGFVGEKTKATHNNYDSSAGKAVDKMLRGEHPTTHIATVHCAKGGDMGMKHMAAGGAGKVRKGEY